MSDYYRHFTFPTVG